METQDFPDVHSNRVLIFFLFVFSCYSGMSSSCPVCVLALWSWLVPVASYFSLHFVVSLLSSPVALFSSPPLLFLFFFSLYRRALCISVSLFALAELSDETSCLNSTIASYLISLTTCFHSPLFVPPPHLKPLLEPFRTFSEYYYQIVS